MFLEGGMMGIESITEDVAFPPLGGSGRQLDAADRPDALPGQRRGKGLQAEDGVMVGQRRGPHAGFGQDPGQGLRGEVAVAEMGMGMEIDPDGMTHPRKDIIAREELSTGVIGKNLLILRVELWDKSKHIFEERRRLPRP